MCVASYFLAHRCTTALMSAVFLPLVHVYVYILYIAMLFVFAVSAWHGTVLLKIGRGEGQACYNTGEIHFTAIVI